MKTTSSLSYLVYTSFLLSSSMSLANPLPSDLEDLNRRWHCVAKTEESSSLMKMQNVMLSPEQGGCDLLLKEVEASGKKVRSLEITKHKEKARHKILAKLFPKGEEDLAFCDSFPEPKVKLEASDIAEVEAAKVEQASFRNCKAKVKEVLSGILYADPQVHLGDVHYEDGSSELIFYVESTMDANSALRYEFKR